MLFPTKNFQRIASLFTAFAFFCFSLATTQAGAQTINLPKIGMMISVSPHYRPILMTGITAYPENPLQFDFFLDQGDANPNAEELQAESQKMINYFLTTLTVPDEEMWVNLSPYEKDRIIADGLGQTEMGRDMLAQDYMLKQLASSLMYPEDELGKKFWEEIYAKAQKEYGTVDIPTETFNKVWIVPQKASIFIKDHSVFVSESHLSVMLEEDYLAMNMNQGRDDHGLGNVTEDDLHQWSPMVKEVVRDIIIPAIEKEVNSGKTFANLRQIYNAMLLATWYKRNLKKSYLGQLYVNQNKVEGIDLAEKGVKEKIYNQYVEAFKAGVYNYIQEEYNSQTNEVIPRKYFSGGLESAQKASFNKGPLTNPPEFVAKAMLVEENSAMLVDHIGSNNFMLNLEDYIERSQHNSRSARGEYLEVDGFNYFSEYKATVLQNKHSGEWITKIESIQRSVPIGGETEFPTAYYLMGKIDIANQLYEGITQRIENVKKSLRLFNNMQKKVQDLLTDFNKDYANAKTYPGEQAVIAMDSTDTMFKESNADDNVIKEKILKGLYRIIAQEGGEEINSRDVKDRLLEAIENNSQEVSIVVDGRDAAPYQVRLSIGAESYGSVKQKIIGDLNQVLEVNRNEVVKALLGRAVIAQAYARFSTAFQSKDPLAAEYWQEFGRLIRGGYVAKIKIGGLDLELKILAITDEEIMDNVRSHKWMLNFENGGLDYVRYLTNKETNPLELRIISRTDVFFTMSAYLADPEKLRFLARNGVTSIKFIGPIMGVDVWVNKKELIKGIDYVADDKELSEDDSSNKKMFPGKHYKMADDSLYHHINLQGADPEIIKDIVEIVEEARKELNGDRAMMTTPGGIDFNASDLNLQEQGDPISFDFPEVNIDNVRLQDFRGVRPVIQSIQPVVNFPLPVSSLPQKEQKDSFAQKAFYFKEQEV